MKYTVVFLLGGLALMVLAALAGGPAWALLWPGVDLLLLSAIYGQNRADWLGKTADGRMRPLVVAVLLPYFVLTWLTWHLFRRITPEATSNEVAPGIRVGRRPFSADLLPDTALVVDLTAEFAVAAGVADRVEVLVIPTLDARAPTPEVLASGVARVLACGGPAYIHCAAGHGRSATLASAVLVARGDAPTIDAAEKLMQRARPAIHLHRVQRLCAEQAALIAQSLIPAPDAGARPDQPDPSEPDPAAG
ncbi:MAG: hypothetical protein ACI9WU_001919 [Myxococcota bacterium]|jgi:hypothetical protein